MLRSIMVIFFCIVIADSSRAAQGLDSQAELNPENALWEVFTYTGEVTDIIYSDDGTVLWAATVGGLEERDSRTGERLRLYTNLDGLPHNFTTSLITDGEGNLWVGTWGGGIACRSSRGEWKTYTAQGDGLPDNRVKSLSRDGDGGIWIGTREGGLVHRSRDGQWRVYDKDNSELPDNDVHTLFYDDAGSLWVGTRGGGVAHRSVGGIWTVYDEYNSDLPHNSVSSLASDPLGGIWIGTREGGLAHRSSDGQWRVYDKDNSDLPDNDVRTLFYDDAGSLWVGTWGGGLARFSDSAEWKVYTMYNSRLPDNFILSLFPDHEGGMWIGTNGYLIRLDARDDWTVYDRESSGLPDNRVWSLSPDTFGGIWMGTSDAGLAHLSFSGNWKRYNKSNSPLPHNEVMAISLDKAGAVWIGTSGGLAHISSIGNWKVHDKDNSSLPHNEIKCLLGGDDGGLWMGTWGGGLAHLSAMGEWTIYNQQNSHFSSLYISTLARDDSGGVWVGTWGDGLAHISTTGGLTEYTKENSGLPDNKVSQLIPDGLGGIWIGTWGGGLAHISASSGLGDSPAYGPRDSAGSGMVFSGIFKKSVSADYKWNVYTKENSGLADNHIQSLSLDGSGGLWVGTAALDLATLDIIGRGLAHFSGHGHWTSYDVYNSGLPANRVLSISLEDKGGLWIGTEFGGITRLTFGYKQEIPDLPEAHRAAIIVLPKGTDRNDMFALETMSIHAYNTFLKRGFDNDEIYYLAYKPDIDINADGIADINVVNAPVTLSEYRQGGKPRPELTLDDVARAFGWAEKKGSLNHPLYFVFTGHGLPGRLRLDNMNSMLDVSQFNDILTKYQQATGNQVVLILEACHSGTLIEGLSGKNRVIITSTSENQAFYTDNGIGSFSRLFLSELSVNNSFYDAFEFVSNEFQSMSSPFNKQIPLIDDDGDSIPNHLDGSMASQLHLNGNFSALDGTVALEPITESRIVNAGETLNLELQVGYTESPLDVWAMILTPEYVQQRSATGFFLHPAPRVNLSSDDGMTYRGTFTGLNYKGEYVVTFNAKDHKGWISSSRSLTFSLKNGPVPPAVPIPSQPVYHDGDPLQITIPHAPEGADQYVCVTVPGMDSIFMLVSENVPVSFEGTLRPFVSSRELALDLPDVTGLPGGVWRVFLLRVPAGSDPWAIDPSEWILGQADFEVN
ncbi:MAG: hypothetical protein HQK66_00940 [Desulfamplus sp.]|nr:hypothetical protein [Desulfamplus sp.]